LEGDFVFANLKRRIVDSNFFMGISASYVDATVDFDATPEDSFSSGILDFSFVNVGVAGSVIYDGRDNTSMPNSGQQVDFTYWRYDEALGGDFGYWKSRLKIHSFHEIGKKFVLGLRLDMGQAGGRTPFFALPFVRLRGIPALRYAGESAGAVEVEGRYNFAQRWSAIAFAGVGFAEARFPFADTQDDIRAYGAGVRFLALKEQNLWLEVDVAKGPEDYAFYISAGHPW
jgi:outer membrane translocation and assembly module TamA